MVEAVEIVMYLHQSTVGIFPARQLGFRLEARPSA
jgi:hypothetical protein